MARYNKGMGRRFFKYSWLMQKSAIALVGTLVFLSACVRTFVFQSQSALSATERQYVKMFSGHYVAIGGINSGSDPLPGTLSEIKDVPGIVGIQKRYYWSDLQTGPNQFSFGRIISDIQSIGAVNKKLSIFIQWKYETDEDKNPVPDYIQSMTSDPTSYPMAGIGPSANGWLTAMNNPVVSQEFVKFLGALSGAIDSSPVVSSIVFVETAFGADISSMTTDQQNQVRNDYYANLLEIDNAAARAFRHTPVIQLTNFPANKLSVMTQDYVANAVSMGGPDVWLDDPTMTAYDYYPLVKPYIPIGVIVAGGNLEWFNRADEVAQDPTKKIPYSASETIQRLADKAINQLKANFIFWRRLGPSDAYYQAFMTHVKKLGTPSQTIPPTDSSCPLNYDGICLDQ
jgi:hypothetical protein